MQFLQSGLNSARAVLRLNDRRARLPEGGARHGAAPEGRWTLWGPIALAVMTALIYSGLTGARTASGCFLLLAGLQSYLVVWCMIVGAVPVGFRWYYSESEPYGFSIAAIALLLIALILGWVAVLTGPG